MKRSPDWHGSKQRNELVHRQARIANYRTKRPPGDLLMVGDRQTAMRYGGLPQDDVAAGLVVDLIAEFSHRPDQFSAGDRGKLAHNSTSTTSSVIAGGIGSLCLRRLSK